MIKYGEKITPFCKVEKCIHYNTIVALSNDADLKSNVVCPKIFCDSVFANDSNDVEVVIEKLKKQFSLTKEQLDLKLYIENDDKMKVISFFNPMNSSPAPLVWSYEYLKKSNIENLKKEFDLFFETFLHQFEEKSCNGCKFENTNMMSMTCVDCIRNINSKSIIKNDRFKS